MTKKIIEATEKELKDIQSEIADIIRKQKEENAFKPSLEELLGEASKVIDFENKLSLLTLAVSVFKNENLEIPEATLERIEAYDFSHEEIMKEFEEKITIALSEMTQEHLFQFIDAYYSYSNVDHFAKVVKNFNDGHKKKVLEILEGDVKDNYDAKLKEDFLVDMKFSIELAKEKGIFEISDELEPFEEFIDKYMTTYDNTIVHSIGWLEELSGRNLSDSLIQKYADAAVRRLKIGVSPKEPKYVEAHADMVKILESLKG